MDTSRPTWLLISAAALTAATLLGAALAPYLVIHHPLWLLALNPWPRHQLLTAPRLAAPPFIGLITARNVFSSLVSYELGRRYGVVGAAFLEGQWTRGGKLLRALQGLFVRYSNLVLSLAPGVFTNAMAGASGLSRLRCVLFSSLGTFVWAAVNYRLGGLLSPWTAPILDFIRHHMLSTTLACCAFVLVYHLFTRARARAR